MSQDGPIIVRKKRDDGEEEHHGGVWKLAFADFMTAMMAFFLVMWLINSTTKETKAVIVQYFNPVQLVDATSAHKGMRDPNSGGEGKSAAAAPPTTNPTGGPSKDIEAALQSEPLKTLDEIANKERPRASNNASSSSSPRDPFDRTPKDQSHAPSDGAPSDRTTSGEKTTPRSTQAPTGEKAKNATELQAEIDRIAAQEIHAPRVDVKQTDEGLIINLTDDAGFSMFDVGSIQPKPQLVRIIAQIGKILATKHGEVELRGHTDGRSYAGRNYDNWRLSSDRATIVNYMLLRGGLPAGRIGKIVGFADRRPRNQKDPLSPVNRRIEILLRGDVP